jgi:butyryl-CoA dehydrogenase
MLLRQKAIVEGGLALVLRTARYSDLATHGEPATSARAQLLLDLLTPITKSFPAELGFEANSLALQIHGGYGYSSEYLPEAWLRDQKLNSIHEGTTGIQGLDLLGRRAIAADGAALHALVEEVTTAIDRAAAACVSQERGAELLQAVEALVALTGELAGRGSGGDVAGMLRHSTDYLDLFGTVVVAWQHLDRAAAAAEGLADGRGPDAFYRGVLAAADYWFATEVPRTHLLTARIRSGEDSFARMQPDWF